MPGEKQFTIDGVTFGLGTSIGMTEDGWTPGGPSLRTNDVDVAGGSGRRFGREFRGETVWGFSLYTNTQTEEDAWATLSALRAAWESLADQADVTDSEVQLPLFYRIAGKDRLVYGRPQRFDYSPTNLSLSGRIDIQADFKLSYPLYFAAQENSFNLSILPPLNVEAGVIVPVIVPFVSSSSDSERKTSITVGGERPTPIVVKLIAGTGARSNARVEIGGNVVQLTQPVEPEDPVVIDPRPWARSVSTVSGGTVAVDARVSRLSKFWLPPGTHEIVFNGTDPTGSATAVISWHDAYRAER
jgi:hypothetical protein